MSTTKPSFKSIDFGSAAAAIDKFAKLNGVPDLVYPSAAAEGKGPEIPLTEPAAAPPAVPVRKVKAVAPPSPAPIKRLAVELPEYLVKAVSDKAHSSDTTIRYVITQALQKAGFFVDAADLKEDGRRGR